MKVFVERCQRYDMAELDRILGQWEFSFRDKVRPGDLVVMKPNWISHAHKHKPDEWHSVITHPLVITSVLKMVLRCLNGRGKVVITDGPQTDVSWKKIMDRMTPEKWIEMGKAEGVQVEVMDLRDDEWIVEGDVNILRRKLPGDPLGSTECDLSGSSEFCGYQPGSRGFYGADYDTQETNQAHSNGRHKYRVSKTVISADVFINLPKMKTHKKAGITCSLKNLVGINTYKNWLPHHSEGTPDEGGDQFPVATVKTKAEVALLAYFKHYLNLHPDMGKWFIPMKALGKKVFGETQDVIRSGNWHGNRTIWRMILDLNKVLLYARPDGTFREDHAGNRKRYISIVDGIIAGEGNGPEAPDPKSAGFLIAGTNPVAVDAVCARLMGFDWKKIPSIMNAFAIRSYQIADFSYKDIVVDSNDPVLHGPLEELPLSACLQFRPHFGWANHVEVMTANQSLAQ